MRNAFSLFFLGSWHTIRAGGKNEAWQSLWGSGGLGCWTAVVPVEVRGGLEQCCPVAEALHSIDLLRSSSIVQFGGKLWALIYKFCLILRLRALSLSRFLQNIQPPQQRFETVMRNKEWLWQGWLVPQEVSNLHSYQDRRNKIQQPWRNQRKFPAYIRRRANFNSASFLALF